jgi:hypothetical protein
MPVIPTTGVSSFRFWDGSQWLLPVCCELLARPSAGDLLPPEVVCERAALGASGV